MVKVRKNLSGQKFGKLTVIEQTEDYISPKGRREDRWRCICDCGKITGVSGHNLRAGRIISCGCSRIKTVPPSSISLSVKGQRKPSIYESNVYDLTKEYGIGYIRTGYPFYFDLEDYDKICGYSWYELDGYIYYIDKYTNKKVFMHRFLMSVPDGFVIDHLNHRCNDNRKSNLKVCTQGDNMKNKSMYKRNKSGHTGVRFDKRIQKWTAMIGHNKKLIWLGTFNTKEEAIKVRKDAEIKYNYIAQNS